MNAVENQPDQEPVPERVALVWIDARNAYVVRWRKEPVIERLASGVPSKQPAVGSVRRGPARPDGGGRVPGHGTEGRHLEQLDRFFDELARKLADADVIEISGRGQPHRQFAAVMRELPRPERDEVRVTIRTLSRRPSERQLQARLRKMVDRERPRRSQGRYRRGAQGPTTATGRPTPEAAGRRVLRPPRLPERKEIDQEVEGMLSDEGVTGDDST